LSKESEIKKLGESWEVSDLDNAISVVSSGEFKGQTLRELVKKYKNQLLGNSVFEKFGLHFPVLVKFLDAHLPLSIQVHPNNELAKQRYGGYGKSEMWYIIHAEQGSEIITGLSKDITQKEFKKTIQSGSFKSLFRKEKIAPGEVYYLPAGCVHAIGAGSLILEIQQTSDITYRIYDYERIDPETSTKRTLHLEKAMSAINFQGIESCKINYEAPKNGFSKLLKTPFFTTNMLEVKEKMTRNLTEIDSFVIYTCVEGVAEITIKQEKATIAKGETILLPAVVNQCTFSGLYAKMVEVYF
jgi:mannose-6-phosphate isomerase